MMTAIMPRRDQSKEEYLASLPELRRRKARNLERLIKESGLTPKQIGERMGIDPNNIYAMTTGKRSITDDMVAAFCREFKWSDADFVRAIPAADDAGLDGDGAQG